MKSLEVANGSDRTHTEVQGWLRDLGRALGYDVWIAANDRNRPYRGGRLCDGCLEVLPDSLERLPSADAVRLIDVLWLEGSSGAVAAAFEVEHTTSIYSGIVRLLDLALGGEERATQGLFLVAGLTHGRPTCAPNCLARRSAGWRISTSGISRIASSIGTGTPWRDSGPG